MTIEELAKKITEEGGFIQLSKILMHNLGTDEAVVYTEMIKNQKYYKEQRQLTIDGFFFFTIEDMEYNCNVKKDKQARIIRDLKSRGLIEVKHKGMPKRRYFKVLEDDYAINRTFTDDRVKPEDTEKEPLPDELKAKQKAYNEAMQETHKEEGVANLETPENPSITKGKAIIDEMMKKETENEPQTSETIVDDVITPTEDFTFKIDEFSSTYNSVAREIKTMDAEVSALKEFSEILYETVPPTHPISRNSIEKSIKAFKNSTYVKDYLLGEEGLDEEVARAIINEFAKSTAKDKTMNLLLSDKWMKPFCERYRCNEA